MPLLYEISILVTKVIISLGKGGWITSLFVFRYAAC